MPMAVANKLKTYMFEDHSRSQCSVRCVVAALAQFVSHSSVAPPGVVSIVYYSRLKIRINTAAQSEYNTAEYILGTAAMFSTVACNWLRLSLNYCLRRLTSKPFLANVNSSSCSLYVVVCPSVVCRLSVTFVRPTQTIEIFGNVSTL